MQIMSASFLVIVWLVNQVHVVMVLTFKRDSVHDLQGRGPILGTMHIPSAFFPAIIE